MTNRYAAKCAACGELVQPGEGNAHKVGAKWATTHLDCPRDRKERENAEAYEYRDEDNADAFVSYAVLDSWRERESVGGTDQGAYYDTTTYRVRLPRGITASQYRHVISRGDGQAMASYGTFGGYSTIGRVTDNGDGTARVESVYHLGD